ncbi:MAG: hypothetical protein U0105_22545 [Candidatus Obscuribacterales bacterium]
MRLMQGVTTDVSLEDELQQKKAEAMDRLQKRSELMREFLKHLVSCDGKQQWASVT